MSSVFAQKLKTNRERRCSGIHIGGSSWYIYYKIIIVSLRLQWSTPTPLITPQTPLISRTQLLFFFLVCYLHPYWTLNFNFLLSLDALLDLTYYERDKNNNVIPEGWFLPQERYLCPLWHHKWLISRTELISTISKRKVQEKRVSGWICVSIG